AWRGGIGQRPRTHQQAAGRGVAGRGARGQAGPDGEHRLPHVDHQHLFRCGAAYGNLVRKARSQYIGHAPFHPPAVRRGRPGLGGAERLEHLPRHRQAVFQRGAGSAGRRARRGAYPIQHGPPGELAQPYEPKAWLKGECEPVAGKTMPSVTLVERNYPETYARFTSMGPLLEKLGNGGKGIGWDTRHEVELLADLNGRVAEGPTAGRPRIDTDIDACETILMLAPETNGEVALKAWAALGKVTGRDHGHLAEGKEEEKIRFRDIVSQPRKIISSPTWSGIESEKVCYNAGYTNVHELIPWRTLSGRQQLYQDHHWMRAFGEAFVTWRPPVDTRSVASAIGKLPNGNAEIQLNILTPHQKWGIHSTYTENLIMLSLNRGGPSVWISEKDAAEAGIVDNDWIEAFNVNGALTARAIVSQRIMPGSCIMYHAQEKVVNTVGSEITGQRGGIHIPVPRINMKPTHMIGGYAQLAYGFNYYGPVGANRDEIVILRKMSEVNWFDKAADDDANVEGGTADRAAGNRERKEAAE